MADTNHIYDMTGWPNDSYSALYNKPLAGFTGLREGQVFKTGETVHITGYADGYNEQVTGFEISMDQGETWNHFDIDDADVQQLVTWEYDFTPTEDGAYTIQIRTITAEGTVAERNEEKMFIARSDYDDLMAQYGSIDEDAQ